MENKVINLQVYFAMSNSYFIKGIQECFDTVNAFLKSKSGAIENPLFIHENERGEVCMGYKPLVKTKGDKPFFSDEVIRNSWGSLERACMTQFVIFEACKAYGCYEDVPMCGAPEEEQDAYFTFTMDGVNYKYQLWLKLE